MVSLPFRDRGFEAIELESGDIPEAGPSEMTLFGLRPFKDTPGFDAATEFVRGVAPIAGSRMSFEPWFDDSRITFVVGVPTRGDLEDIVNSHFPNSVIKERNSPLPEMEPGEYLAGARMELSKDCAYPIRHPESTDGFDDDPYRAILPKLLGRDADRAMIQVTFRRVGNWYRRGVVGPGTDKISQSVGKGRVVGERNPTVVQTQADSDIESDMQDQRSRAAFQTVVRVFAISPEKREAERRASAVADILDEQYDHVSGQGFETTVLRGGDLRRGVQAASRRTIPGANRVYRWLRGPSNVLTDWEVAGLAHPPSAEINIPDVDWARMEAGAGVPPDAPQFKASE